MRRYRPREHTSRGTAPRTNGYTGANGHRVGGGCVAAAIVSLRGGAGVGGWSDWVQGPGYTGHSQGGVVLAQIHRQPHGNSLAQVRRNGLHACRGHQWACKMNFD
jgi:hypothetical protein